MKYAIEIMHNDYLPFGYRQYIWQGGTGRDLNEDGIIATTPNADGIIESNVPWCFGYGESEWINPEHHPLTGVVLTWQGYRDLAVSDISRRVSCE